MFRGVSSLSLDVKGRLAIPARYRARLQDESASRLVATVGVVNIEKDRCLVILPEPEWLEIERNLVRMPGLDPKTRTLQRLLMGFAHELDMDGQGRVLLPKKLRDFASLSKQVALVGQGNKFELWDEETWNGRCDEWLGEADLTQLESLGNFASLSI